MPSRTPEGDALTRLVLPAFELNGEFLAAAEVITRPHDLTPARWQVLGAVIDEPLPVAEIARRVGLGLARQSVQRVADDLVTHEWATWAENPHHRRAKLLAATDRGIAAVRAMAAEQHRWADAVGTEIGLADLACLADLIRRVIEASRSARG
ncbi:MarR family winged helix-turn-helix transcriptional regulator [Blastococcus sp. Marseille-P5729]|uniref:MarR family winged helix-turn-helix transcriptional regulator n=1 Tax=Blastococcus sp. Marseille-P5729 TaxID=2086582 RepID=UPI000D0F1472|nr:MarR family transcriptional regulator [Blastococcus sp. Marseille-P5729]